MRDQIRINRRTDFRAALLLQFPFSQEIIPGTEYEFRNFAGSEPGGFSIESEIVSRADADAIARAIADRKYAAFSRPGRGGVVAPARKIN